MALNVKHVTFKNLAWDTAADLYLPPDFSESKKYPAIVSGHPIGSCKEQTAGNVYGARLAQQGYIVCAYDASFQGASGGDLRALEDPSIRVGDFRFVIDYLVSLPYVDAERIGALGICGAGGYVISATMTDYRIKAVVSITGVNYGRLSREGFAQFRPVDALKAMAKQRTAEAQGGERNVIRLIPTSVEEAKAAGIEDRDILEAVDYYTNRSPAPNGKAQGLYSFNSAAVGWDAYAHAEVLLTQPLLVVIGDLPGGFGAYRDGNEIHARAGSKDKELLCLPGVSHYDLYDKPEAVDKAFEKIIPFFEKFL